MRRADIIIAIAAFIVAALAAFGVYLLLSTQNSGDGNQKPKDDIPLKDVLVATKNIELGEPIASVVRLEKWPESSVHTGFFSQEQATPEHLKSLVARRAIVMGEPINETAVLDQKDHGVLAALLGAGMRAISIGVDPVSLAGGLVLPGDIVDVILAYVGGKPEEEVISRTILCGVRVLAFDQRLTPLVDALGKKVEASSGSGPHTVTLEVTPEQAELLASAIKMGALSLSLRSTSTAQDKDCTTKPLKDGHPVEDKAAKDKANENNPLEDKIRALEEKLGKKKMEIEIFRAGEPPQTPAALPSPPSQPQPLSHQ